MATHFHPPHSHTHKEYHQHLKTEQKPKPLKNNQKLEFLTECFNLCEEEIKGRVC